MTSQKSSVNTFSRSFWHTVRSYPYIPALGLIGLLIGVVLVANTYNSGYFGYFADAVNDPSKYAITETVRYSIFGSFSGAYDIAAALHVSLAGVAVILAQQIFRFVCTKKSTNVWFGLGITRKKLFVSKYLAGLFMISLMLIVPFLISLIVNISVFGVSRELMFSWFYLLSGYWVFTVNIYTLTCTVTCLAGTAAESIIYSATFLATPMLIFYEITNLMNRLTFGSEFCMLNGSISSRLSNFNPISFLYQSSAKYSDLTRDDITLPFSWEMPDFTGVITFFIVICLLFALGTVLIGKRRTEIAGFWGASKSLRFLASLDAVMIVFSMTASYTGRNSFTAIIAGLVAGAVIYLIVNFLLIFNAKVWTKSIKYMPIHLGIAAVAGIIFATGLFGYSTRIPSLENIKSMSISPTTYTGVFTPNTYDTYISQYSGLISGYASDGYSTVTLTDKDDIKLISNIHRQFIDWGKLLFKPDFNETDRSKQILGGDYIFKYTLSDGSTVTRCYDYAPMNILSSFAELEGTKLFSQRYNELFTSPISKADDSFTASSKDMYQNTDNAVYLTSKFMSPGHSMLNLTPQQRTQLLAALAKDYATVSVSERVKPQTQQLAILVFTRDSIKGMAKQAEAFEKCYAYDSYDRFPTNSYLSDYSYSPSPFYPGISSNEYGLDSWFFGDSTSSIMLTKSMVNTLKFFDDNGLSSLFAFDGLVESAAVISYKDAMDNGTSDYLPKLQFACSYFRNEYYIDSSNNLFGDATVITDKEKLASLESSCYSSYYTDNNVYYVWFNFTDGGHAVMCIPSSLAPAWLATN